MYDGQPDRLESRPRDEDTNEAIRGFVQKLEREAERRVQLRSNIEQRWIDDLRMYHGLYDEKTIQQIKANEGSELFVNLIGPKTDAFAAKMMDLLFPTEDRNWDLRPSPVPEMDRQEEQAQERAQKAKATLQDAQARWADTDPERTPEFFEQADQDRQAAEQELSEMDQLMSDMADIRAEAKTRADMMRDEMDDQLKATNYQAECRDMLEDACKIGTGVMFGPVLSERQHLQWSKGDGGFTLQNAMDMRPGYQRRDPWGFFPDPDARSVQESEGFFYRHLLNKKAMRRLARRPGVDKDALREIIKADAVGGTPQNMSDLYAVTNDHNHSVEGKYQVWEYIGPIEAEELLKLIASYQDTGMAEEVFGSEEIDPLMEIHARIEFCQGEVLSFALHPLESNEPVYSVYNVKKAEVGLFGFGIPYIGRSPQSAFNAAWRAMMDNGRLAIAPQIVINKDVIRPEDNGHNFTLSEGRIWHRVTGEDNAPAFEVYNFPINQEYLGNVIEMARIMLDETTAMPQLAQGEQGTGITKTAQGMALLMNASNVVFRRMVKNWDDDVTIPNIRRLYDFNMQFSEKEHIKGDYEPFALGSSVLLVREMQATNLMQMAINFGDHPEYGAYLDKSEILKEVFKATMVPTAGIIRSEAEVREEAEKAAQQPNPEVELKQQELELRREDIQSRIAIAEMETESRRAVAEFTYQGKMESVAAGLNMKVEELEARLGLEREKIQSSERKLATEAGVAVQTGKHAGGSV